MEHGDQQSVGGQQEWLPAQANDMLAPTAKSLIAIGAAAALNCHPCLNYLIPAALQNGVLEEEIEATISVVGQIRRNAASFTDRLANDLLLGGEPAEKPEGECC